MVKILTVNLAKYFAIYFDYKMPIYSLLPMGKTQGVYSYGHFLTIDHGAILGCHGQCHIPSN